MSISEDDDIVTISFPDLSPADAAQIARELERELIKAGIPQSEIRVVRDDPEAMDLGSILVVVANAFLEAAAKKAWEKAIEWLCRKYQTRVEAKSRRWPERTYGEQRPIPGLARIPRNLATLGVVILGASEFPHMEELNNPAFARSADLVKSLLTPEHSVFRDVEVLDLFDQDLRVAEIVDAIEQHIDRHMDMQDLLIYYCGHGSFMRDSTYFLTLRGTRKGREAATGLKLRDLRHDLEPRLLERRLYLILDCCFAGEAVKEFMSAGVEKMVELQLLDQLPTFGWAVLTASSPSMTAIAPLGESYTMFTEAIAEVLNHGAADGQARLSLGELSAEAYRTMIRKHGSKAVQPQCHAPLQDAGDVSRIPLFLNKASLPVATLPEPALVSGSTYLPSSHEYQSRGEYPEHTSPSEGQWSIWRELFALLTGSEGFDQKLWKQRGQKLSQQWSPKLREALDEGATIIFIILILIVAVQLLGKT